MRSKLDATQIAQYTYDPDSESTKVKITDTEMSMELSHVDGDSITSHPAKLSAAAIGVVSPADDNIDIIPAMDASSFKQVHVHINGTGNIVVKASPSDTEDVWYDIGPQAVIHEICARRIKVTSTDAVGDVYLVGRG